VIYAIDMDGVVADFVGAAAKCHNKDLTKLSWPPCCYEIERVFQISRAAFWNRLNHEEFWAEAPKTEFADELMLLFRKSEKFFLTSPTRSPSCLSGKMLWIERHYPGMARKFLMGPVKQYCAAPDICLVDDSDKNINAFRKRGGKTILVPQIWNTAYQHIDRRLEYIKEQLGGHDAS